MKNNWFWTWDNPMWGWMTAAVLLIESIYVSVIVVKSWPLGHELSHLVGLLLVGALVWLTYMFGSASLRLMRKK